MIQIPHKHKHTIRNRNTFLQQPEITSSFLNDSNCLLWLKRSIDKNVSINLQWPQARAQNFEGGGGGGSREGAINQRQCSHSLNQPSERNERGHVYEEVITRGNRAVLCVCVCVCVGGGGGSRGRRSSTIVETNGGVSLFPLRLWEKNCWLMGN